VYLLDPEELSFVELFALCLVCIVGVMALCQGIDMGYNDSAQVNYNAPKS
jgi:hypothetical protein